MSVLTRLVGALTTRKSARATTFWELVRKVADDVAVRIDEAEEALEAAGKSAEDLAAAVSVVQQRRAKRETIEASRIADEKARGIEAELRQVEAAFAAIRNNHLAEVAELRAKIVNARKDCLNCDDAKEDLIRTCPCPSLKDQLASALNRQQAARATMTKLREQIERAESNHARLSSLVGHEIEAELAVKRRARYQAEHDEQSIQFHTAREQEAELRARMFEADIPES